MIPSEVTYAKELEAAKDRIKRLKDSLAWRRKVCQGKISSTDDLSSKPEPEQVPEPEKKDEAKESRLPLQKLVAERLLDPELELPAEAGALHKQVACHCLQLF